MLQVAQAVTGRHRYVFAPLYPGKRPMSENMINAAIRVTRIASTLRSKSAEPEFDKMAKLHFQ